jgi:alkylation response protein AidB-like acyl-CoA dehydrogenase
MDLFPTDEQQLLSDTARDFVTRSVDPQLVRELEKSELGYDLGHWLTTDELGWTTLPPLELAIVVEQLGRRAVPSPLVVTGALRNALPDFAAGVRRTDAVLTLAAVVPGAIDERTGPYPPGGASVTGSYLLVPYAAGADVIVVETADGLIAVDAARGEVATTREEVIGGDALYRVDFTDAPATTLAGDLAVVLDHLAITALAYTVGAAEAALGLSVQHAKDRHQFGRPIGSFQAVAHRCADMRAEIDASRVLVQRAAWALTTQADPAFAVSSALGYAKDALRRVAMHAHQVHGAIGFSSEHDLHLYTRRIKAFELSYGSSASHQERFATAIGLQS